ncbi:hypothetical protein JCM3774_001543 [Rhodotorula dairenensis]
MLDAWQDAVQRAPIAWIVAASVLLRLSTSALLVAAHLLLPTWDAEVTTLSHPISPYLDPFVRWDTVHFAHIALDGYTSDQQSAFLPGLPALMRFGGEGVHRVHTGAAGTATADDIVLAGVVLSAVASTTAAIVFHRLTQRLFPNRPDFAAFATAMFLLAPSRPTLHAVPYTEPFAALFTFLGMLLFLRKRDLLASVAWAAGSLFRAQGVVLGVGFFGWRYLLQDVWRDGPGFSARHIRRLLVNAPVFAFLATVSSAPFLAFEAYIFRQFCSSESSDHPWCSQSFGMSYGWVQREYWNSGFLRYWTPLQLPNFILAAPVLVLCFAASHSFYSTNPEASWRATVPFLPIPTRAQRANTGRPDAATSVATFTQPLSLNTAIALVPFVHLSTFITTLLFLAHHVQIILRVCVTNPVPFWYAAELLLRDRERRKSGEKSRSPRWGVLWTRYCWIWGTASIVLWAVFLPPA